MSARCAGWGAGPSEWEHMLRWLFLPLAATSKPLPDPEPPEVHPCGLKSWAVTVPMSSPSVLRLSLGRGEGMGAVLKGPPPRLSRRKAPAGLSLGPGCRQHTLTVSDLSLQLTPPGAPPPAPHDPVCSLPLKCRPARRVWSSQQYLVTNSPAPAQMGWSVFGAPLSLGLPESGPNDCALVCCSENEALWREVASLRQKHAQQQKVVNKVGGGPAGHLLVPVPSQADRASPPTAHPVPHLTGPVQPDPGGEEKDVRR